MKTLKLTVELTYDDELMHASDPEAIRWFYEDIVKNKIGHELSLIHI